MIYRVGQTFRKRFTTRDAVTNELYDPIQVQVSFLKSTTAEDILTYGGSGPRDSWLTKYAVGTYDYEYTLDAATEWRIAHRYSDDGFVTETRGDEIVLQVLPEYHSWVNIPVGPSGGQHRVYWGAGVAGIILPATIEAMSHWDSSNYNFTTTPIAATAQKIYIAFPGSWATPSITLDGLAVDTLPVTSIMLHDADASIVAYDLYETTNLLTDASMQFVVTF
jgi:hypothetical protein